MIAANFPSPPTDAARQACVAFIVALPYLVPCWHCGCMGPRRVHQAQHRP